MKLSRLLLSTAVVVALGLAAAGSAEQREMKIKVRCLPGALADVSGQVLEFYDVTPEYTVCAVSAVLYADLKARGFDIEVLVPDVAERARMYDGFFHTYAQLRDTWGIIAQNYPDICVLDTMGTSAGGNLLLIMKISDNPGVMEGEPRICFDFSMHGNENNGCEIAHWSLLQLVNGHGSDPQITYFVNNREIWLAPMDNPDGLISRSRGNAHGVDCNRNYGYAWDAGGPSVFSEPETYCFYHLAEENPMAAWSQYHSGAESSMWPWFYTSRATMDSVVHAFEMQRYGQICGWPAYQISRGLYPGNGGSTDWYYGARGALGYAHEVCDGQPSPQSQIDTINRMNWTAMKEQIQRVSRGVMGYVTDSASGLPLYARVVTNPPDWFTHTDSTGYYHKNLQSGTYSVTAVANGYTSKTVASVVVPTDSFARVNVVLVRDTTAPACAFKVLTCYLNETPSNSNPTFASHALGRRDNRRFSIGNDGYASFDMGKRTPIVNGAGTDFAVVEGDADPEACSVFVSNDWNSNWRYVGFGTGTQSYDLTVAGLSTARFVRIVDDNSGGSGGNAGYDLDAIEAVVVNAPALVYVDKAVIDSQPGGNNDGRLDPGENAGLVLTVKNAGRVGVTGVTAVLRTSDAYVSVTDSTGSFGNLPPDSVRQSRPDRFALAAAGNTPIEHAAQMRLYLTGTDYSDSILFSVVVGELRSIDPIPDGPRTPALYWAYDDVDSGYAQHPTYEWVELRGIGTRLTLSDDQTRTVALPTEFGPWRFYAQNYAQVSVCSNGWVAPGSTTSSNYTPVPLPSASVPVAVYLNWADLYPPAGGGVWYYHDAANHRFVVEFDSVRYYSGGMFDKFELVIYDTTVHSGSGDNIFVQQIKTANGSWGGVGMQDPSRTIGIQYSGHRAAAGAAAGRAIKYTTDLTGIAEPGAGVAAGRLALEPSGTLSRGRFDLRYALPVSGSVTLAVYDRTGRLVRTVVSGSLKAGRHSAAWDGRDNRGRAAGVGVYLIRLSTASGSATARAVLLR